MADEINYGELSDEQIAANEKAAAAQTRRATALSQQASNDLIELMKDGKFRRYLFTVLERAGIYSAVCHAHQGQQYFADGTRALGLMIMNEALTVNPDALSQIIAERAKYLELIDDGHDPRNPL